MKLRVRAMMDRRPMVGHVTAQAVLGIFYIFSPHSCLPVALQWRSVANGPMSTMALPAGQILSRGFVV